MSDDAGPQAGFGRLRQAARKRGPLSFEALSASLEQAQAETGFVDTLGAEPTASGPATAAGVAVHGVAEGSPLAQPREADSADPQPDAKVEETSTGTPVRRRGRVRAPFVQCNLKLSENLRDALHLQALRERRTVADLVTEVMTAYLDAKGTFERLR